MLVGKFERDLPGRCSSFVWKTLSLHRQPNEMLCIMISLRQALDDEEKVVIKGFFSFLLFLCLWHSVLRNDTTNIPVPFKCKFYPEMPAAAMRPILRIHHAIRRRLFERWIALSTSQGHLSRWGTIMLMPLPGRGAGGGGTPGNSWWGRASRFFKSWPYFRPKNVIFYTRFQTRPLKSIPVFRPGP